MILQKDSKLVLITGINGFIGRNLVNSFANDNIIGISRIGNNEKNHRLEYLQWDPNTMNNAKVIIHLAGKAHDLRQVTNPIEYYESNSDLTIEIFNHFINSNVEVFIFLSSIKAVSDSPNEIITEDTQPNPKTHYGKSKLQAEEYILSQSIPSNKRVYILRPCMIHGKGNKGNLNLLHKIILNRIPWPLGVFDNRRSYCSIENLQFIIRELIDNSRIPNGIYNVADDESLSTREVVKLIGYANNIKPKIYSIPAIFIIIIARIGDILYLPLNTERLKKLTESYILDNSKIKNAIKKPLPISSRDGLIKTFKFFNENDL